MWYKEDCIDYNKPIFCDIRGDIFLLVPQIASGYKIKHYDWMNIKTGEYNSCIHYRTAAKACESYKEHKIFNAELKAINLEA